MPRHRLSFFVSLFVSSALVVPVRRSAAQAVPNCQTGCTGGYSVDVTPDNASTSRNPNSSPDTVTFTVTNTGETSDTYTMSCSRFGGVTCTSVSPTSKTLLGGRSATVTVVFSLGVTDGQVYLTASGHAGDQGWYNVTVKGKPVVDATPYNWDNQQLGRCAQACFAAVYAQSTVPYFSLDAPRNVTLAYNEARVKPRIFVPLNVSPDPGYSAPTKYQLQVKVNGALVTFVNGEQTLNFAYTGSAATRISGEFIDSTHTTGVYPMDILVSAVYATSVVTTGISTKLVVVNEATNPVARGWTVAEIQRLYLQADGSALITDGTGSAVYFAKNGAYFTAPVGEFSNLTAGASTYTRSYPDSTKVIFDNTGKMVNVVDRFGNRDSVNYDANGRIWKLTDPQSLTITLAYGTNGLSSITDAGSPARVTNVTVDASKRLTAIQDPDGISTTFGYDASLRLSTITNRNGATATLGYDANAGTLTAVTGPSVTFYDGTAAPVESLFTWQKVGVPYAATSDTPFTPPPVDSAYARLREPGGAMKRFTVNHWGTPARLTDALAHVTTITFDSTGLPIRVGYPSGAVDSAVYNASGLATFVQTADATNRRTIRYAGWAQPDSASGGPQPSMRAFIGTNGRVDSVRTAGSSVTRFTYDGQGRVVSSTAPSGNLIVKRWFGGTNGNTSKDSIPGGVTTYLYDAYGRDTSVDGPASPMRRFHYDSLNRQTLFRDGVYTPPTTIVYDSMGHLVSVTDEKNQVYRFAYNALGWLTARTDPAGRADTLKYSRDGDLMRFVNRRNQTISFAYDALHRVTSKSGTNSDSNGWGFATNGRTLAASDPLTLDSTFLNGRGQPDSVVTRMAGHRYARLYTYSTIGLVESVVVTNDAGLTFRRGVTSYDSNLRRLAQIRLNKPAAGIAGATAIARNNDLLPATTTYRGGDQVTHQYDTQNSLAQISTGALYGSDIGKSLWYDAEGRLQLQVNNDMMHAIQFTYDGLGRVRSDSALYVTQQGIPPECGQGQIIGDNGVNCLQYYTWQNAGGAEFSYDSVGNRRDQGGTYGTGNRIQTFAGCSYTTDNDGNVTGRNSCGSLSATFKWTAESRLDTVIVGGQTIGYRYNAAGQLVRKDVNGTPQTYFLWDGDNLLAELNGTGTGLVAEYSYYPGLDNPHAMVYNGVEYEAHRDALGNVIALTDSLQNEQRTYTYDAWGNLTDGIDNLPFNGADRARWKGALWLGNEANLYYMRARWYEPATGRFLSEDPLGVAAGINPNTFGGDDPVNLADPDGQCPVTNHYTDGSTSPDNVVSGEVRLNDDGRPFVCGPDGVTWLPYTPEVSPGGGGIGSFLSRFVPTTAVEWKCTGAIWLAELSAAADASFVAGLIEGLAVRGHSILLRGISELWKGDGLLALGKAQGAALAAIEAERTANSQFGRLAYGQFGFRAGQTVGSEYALGNFSLKDLVPIWGTKRAIDTAVQTCSPQ